MAEPVYKLVFDGPFYVGMTGIDRQKTLTYLPSDTLFGALVVAWQMINRLPPDLNNLALRLTSAFPFAGSVRFFPRPLKYLALPPVLAPKAVKRVEWVSEEIFNHLRRFDRINDHVAPINFMQGGSIWLTAAERERLLDGLGLIDDPDEPQQLALWKEKPVPRVTIDRLSNSSNLFYTGRLKFIDIPRESADSQGLCGLWFAARGQETELLIAGLNYLQEAGLGGQRSTGHGAFRWQPWIDAAPLPEPDINDRYFISLARYAPTQHDSERLRADQAAYKLVTVRGWCHDDDGHPWRRRQVRLVAEGAYLGWPGSPPGQLVDVTPAEVGNFEQGRRVYRYGWAFPVKAV